MHGRILTKINKDNVDEVWAPTVLLPFDQNKHLVPLLKDLFHICLEPEAQGHSMTFKVYNVSLITSISHHKKAKV